MIFQYPYTIASNEPRNVYIIFVSSNGICQNLQVLYPLDSFYRLLQVTLRTDFQTEFKPPKETDIFDIRQTYYQDDPLHPLSRKATILVPVDKLLASADHRHNLCLLAGSRYSHSNNSLRITSDRFPTHSMNVKWCFNSIENLVRSAQVGD